MARLIRQVDSSESLQYSASPPSMLRTRRRYPTADQPAPVALGQLQPLPAAISHRILKRIRLSQHAFQSFCQISRPALDRPARRVRSRGVVHPAVLDGRAHALLVLLHVLPVQLSGLGVRGTGERARFSGRSLRREANEWGLTCLGSGRAAGSGCSSGSRRRRTSGSSGSEGCRGRARRSRLRIRAPVSAQTTRRQKAAHRCWGGTCWRGT